MTSPENQPKATSDSDFTKTWRYKAGLAMIVIGNLTILLALFIPALGGSSGLVGAMVVGGELLSLASIVFLGKAGFKAIKSKFFAFVKTSYTGPVSRTRHYIGIALLLTNLLVTAVLALYAGDSMGAATPKGPHPIVWGLDLEQQKTLVTWLFLIDPIAFLLTIYVLGADWWGRFRRMFVWEKTEA